MGKDKAPKAAAAPTAAASPPIIGLNGKPLIPRGHKQKGAGTVIVDKGPVVTSDGIVLKSYERLPTQLLQEFCQREKRPAPRYNLAPPGTRYNVLMADTKNSKNDLNFCPVQSGFESDKVAKDMAALLALFHYQKTLPLERKLPEPYCTTWLEMLAAEKEAKGGGKPAAAGKLSASVAAAIAPPPPTATAPAAEEERAKFVKPPKAAIDVKIDRATADWLCVQCNAQNFATLANGTPRSRCFKCQHPKTDDCELIVSVAKASAGGSAAGAGVNAALPKAISLAPAAAPASLVVPAAEPIPVKKAAPAAVVGLRASAPAVSKADLERQQADKIAQRNKKRGYFDALRRANKPSPILLSPNMKRMLEEALGLSQGQAQAQGGEGQGKDVLSLDDLSAELTAQARALPPSQRSETALWALAHRPEHLAAVADRLKGQGFTDFSVVTALRAISSEPPSDALLDEIEADRTQAFVPLLLEACLEFLCLQLDDQSLPDAFDARGNEQGRQLEVAKQGLLCLGVADRALVEDLARYGWSADDCFAAVTALGSLTGGAGDRRLDALLLLHDATLRSSAAPDADRDAFLPLIAPSVEQQEQEQEALAAEIETLEAIFAERVQVGARSETGVTRVTLTLDAARISRPQHVSKDKFPFAKAPTTLEMLVRAGMRYPRRPALLLLKNTAVAQEVLLSMQLALWTRAGELCSEGGGEQGVFYSLAAFLETEAGRLVSSGAPAPVSVARALNAHPTGSVSASASASASGSALTKTTSASSLSSLSLSSAPASSSSHNSSGGGSSSSGRSAFAGAGGGSKHRGHSHPFWASSAPRPALSAQAIAAICAGDPTAPVARGSRADASKYSAMLSARKSLPAWAARSEFLSVILRSDTRGMVVTGETGCGKTTQTPQFLLESDGACRVVVAQPRRLAAVGVATRVADEMAVPIGDEVGYMVRGDSKAGARTRLVFCTYGVLLRRLQADPLLQGVDYVVLDEVHERGLESDFALALLASALQRGAKLKLILMSATISTDKFAIYLGERTAIPTANLGPSAQIVPAPVLAIPGFTFPVTEFHKNDYEALVRPTGEDGIGLGGGIGGRRRKGDVDMDLLVRLVLCLATGLGDKEGGDAEAAKSSAMFARATGTVLVFMPGVPEISRFISLVQDAWASRGQYLPSSFGGSDGGSAPILKLLSLHGQLSPAEQRRVFEPCGRGELKVVVATNVAEASVTIPDVTVVIDSCRVKEMAYDEEKQMAALVTKMASQDSLRQRRGRAGRVQAGRCFRSVTAHTHSTLPPTAVPEMLRAPLDRLVLQIKAMDLEESVSQLLRRCPDPPTRSAVLFATGALVRIQALDAEEALTPLGRHLAALPCSPKVGRLLIFGCLLRCAAPASVVAAYLTSRSPFLSAAEPEARNAVDAARARLLKSCAPSCRSDHMLLVEALRGFEACSGASERRRYCRDNALSFDRAQEILQLQAELLDGVAALGFVSSSREALNPRAPCNAHADKPLVVSAALCAGLYPQLAKILRPPKRFVEVMGSALEREVHGKELKFFLPLLPDEQTGGGDASKNVDNDDFDIDTKNMQRVFLHPSSVNVTNATFQASPFVLYGERQATANAAGERAYIRDTTEVTSFPLLFFGGKLEAQYADGTVTVDGWIKFSAPGRLVALVGALRRELDGLLLAKMADPDLDLDSSPVLAATCRLLACNGQG